MLNKTIYTDLCSDKNIDLIKRLNLNLIIRPKEWDITFLAKTITDPNLILIIINKIDEKSMIEIGIGVFLCKSILLTADTYTEYNDISNIVTHIDTRCNLSKTNNFISWYNYTYGK